MIPFEELNVEAYRLLLRIEIALRECLRLSLQQQYGPKWQMSLPGDLLKTIRQSQAEENRPQFDFMRLGPLYYLNFGELLPVLRQKLGRPTADRFGGDCFIKQLENVLSPRNAVSHARSVSISGLKAIEALYKQVETALTKDEFARLLSNPDVGMTPEECLEPLIAWLDSAKTAVLTLSSMVPKSTAYDRVVLQCWWDDLELAGFDCRPVEEAARLMQAYSGLPQGVGSAGIRQSFSEANEMVKVIESAILQLRKAST